MALPNLHKKFAKSAGDSLKKISDLNPLTIHKKGSSTKALFALGLVCFFWGTTWIASKEAVRSAPALQVAGIRQLLAGSCYVLFFLFKGDRWPNRQQWSYILVLSIFNFLLANGLSTWGLKYISSGLGAIIGAIFPLWIVIIELFISRKRMPAKALMGLLLGFAGVCIIFSQHLEDFVNPDFRVGILLSLLGTWGWAFGTIYTKKHAANFNPYFSIGLQMFVSGVMLSIFSYSTGETVPITQIPTQSWLGIGYLVIFGSIISFIAYLYALQKLSTGQTSVYAYVNPVVAMLLGSKLFGERLTLTIGLGGLIALLGVYLVNKAYKLEADKSPETEGV